MSRHVTVGWGSPAFLEEKHLMALTVWDSTPLVDHLMTFSLHGFSPLKETVDHSNKHCWQNKAEAWEVEGIAIVLLVHQPACTRNTEDQKQKISVTNVSITAMTRPEVTSLCRMNTPYRVYFLLNELHLFWGNNSPHIPYRTVIRRDSSNLMILVQVVLLNTVCSPAAGGPMKPPMLLKSMKSPRPLSNPSRVTMSTMEVTWMATTQPNRKP